MFNWGYELVEDDLLWFIFFVHIKVSFLFFNRQELFRKVKDWYDNCVGKEKAAEYYTSNKEVLEETQKITTETCQKKKKKRKYGKKNKIKRICKKKKKWEWGRNRYRNITGNEKSKLKE